jgi:hypothetical protein
MGKAYDRWAWRVDYLKVYFRAVNMRLISDVGVKGKEKQTIGEIYDLFESVGFS